MLDAAQNVGANQSRHLHIEKYELGPQPVDRLHRRSSVGSFTDDVDPIEVREHRAKPGARQWLVVDYQRSNFHAFFAPRGTTSVASKPPSRAPYVRLAASPYRNARRSRKREMPVPTPFCVTRAGT